jgi:hypothetical protein
MRTSKCSAHTVAPSIVSAGFRPAKFALALLAVAQSAFAALISFDTIRNGDAIDIRASAVLHAEFIPDLRVSRVVTRHDSTVTVEQSGIALLWLFRMPVDIVFEIQESPPIALHSRAVSGTLRSLTSSYLLAPAAAGIELHYAGHVAPGFSLFGHFEQAVVERNAARQFQALADEVERQFAAGHP